MTKIFVLDVMFSYGHNKFNKYYLDLLSKNNSLRILNDGYYYNNTCGSNIELLNIHSQTSTKNALLARFNIIKTYLKLRIRNSLRSCDKILVMGYDTLTFPFFFLICNPKSDIYVIQHHNIDECKNSIKRLAFNYFKNKVTHIVLDREFIKALQNKYTVNANIEYLPHYLSKLGYCNAINGSKGDIIALSNSNDEDIVNTLVDLDVNNKLSFLKKRIHIKSNKIAYDGVNLVVYRGYISDDLYSNLFINSSVVLILFPQTYDIRYSCTFIEALINYKIVIANSIWFTEILKKRYPNNIIIFNNVEELLDILHSINHYSFDMTERLKLLEELSEENIKDRLDRIFNNI